MRPPVTYPVSLADLIVIADAACHLESYRHMLVDNPAEQVIVQRHIQQLHDIAERAAAHDAVLIYGADDGA